MTIYASIIDVRLIPPRISGTMLLHDDTHTVVPIAIEPTAASARFEAAPPRGGTYRDDFDEYRREAESIMHTLLTFTTGEAADRDREVSRVTARYGLSCLEGDNEWQQLRWRFIRGEAGSAELETAAIHRSQSGPPADCLPGRYGADSNGKNWFHE
ncbi:hypothetical protein [Frondihabitans australicus]|uniref:Uncharacterized protein n=1 Tax=Frondihabitans australicus TaxID=386892 RepID=A0A495IK15_9MICO|nr:hypothetical protein [Frondihabitans australicus]RKR76307.1 hypothetical protein C8E83_3476 [Frondihabitans australicus]